MRLKIEFLKSENKNKTWKQESRNKSEAKRENFTNKAVMMINYVFNAIVVTKDEK